MAELLYGHIYYQDRFAGLLRQETGDRCSFTYDSAYLSESMPAIALSLPLQAEPHLYPGRLHPYFDNLLAEGRQAAIQARWLGVPVEDRFARLLAFGGDCIGAVSIRDPRPRAATGEMPQDATEIAALTSRASISGESAACGRQVRAFGSGPSTSIPGSAYDRGVCWEHRVRCARTLGERAPAAISQLR